MSKSIPTNIEDRVRKLAYIVPGEGGAPLELFDPKDIVDLCNELIISAQLNELEQITKLYQDPGKLANEALKIEVHVKDRIDQLANLNNRGN